MLAGPHLTKRFLPCVCRGSTSGPCAVDEAIGFALRHIRKGASGGTRTAEGCEAHGDLTPFRPMTGPSAAFQETNVVGGEVEISRCVAIRPLGQAVATQEEAAKEHAETCG